MPPDTPDVRPPGLRDQLLRFALVGVGSTLLAAGLFWLLVQLMDKQAASALSLVLSTIANTAVNRRFSFGVIGPGGFVGVQIKSLILLAMTIALTAAALALLDVLAPGADRLAQVVAFLLGNVVATIVRFALLRRWFAATPGS